MAVTADARTLATACRGEVQLWDLGTRPPCVRLTIPPPAELRISWSALAFAPDGKTLAAGDYHQPIRLIDLTGNKPKERLRLVHRCGTPASLAFSPNGRSLAVGGWAGRDAPSGMDDTVRVYELATGKESWSFTRPKSWVHALRFAPDGKTLAISWYNGPVTLVEVASRKQRGEIQAGKGVLYGIAFSPDGKLLATSGQDGQVAVWAGGTRLWAVQLPGPVAAVAWAPDSRHLATANDNGSVYILRVP